MHRNMDDHLQPYRQAAQQRFPRPYTPPAEAKNNAFDSFRRSPRESFTTPPAGYNPGGFSKGSQEPYETLNAYYSQPPPRGYPRHSPPPYPDEYPSHPQHGGPWHPTYANERGRTQVSASLTYPEQYPERQQWMRDFQRLNPSMGRGSAPPAPFESQSNYSPLRRSRSSRGLLPEVDDFDDDGSNLKSMYPPAARPVEPFGAATSRSVSREREDDTKRKRDVSVSPSRSEVLQRIYYDSPHRSDHSEVHRSGLYDSRRSEGSQAVDKKDMTQLRQQVEQLQEQLRTAKSMLKEVLNTAPDNTSRQASIDFGQSHDAKIPGSSLGSTSPIPADENSDDEDGDETTLESEKEPEPVLKQRGGPLDRDPDRDRDRGTRGRGRDKDGETAAEDAGGKSKKELEDEVSQLLEENTKLQIENEDLEERMHLIEQTSMSEALLNMKETYAEEVGRRHNLLKQYQEMEKQRLKHLVYLVQGAMQEVGELKATESGWRLQIQIVDGMRRSFWINTTPSAPNTTWQMWSVHRSQVLTPRTPEPPVTSASDAANGPFSSFATPPAPSGHQPPLPAHRAGPQAESPPQTVTATPTIAADAAAARLTVSLSGDSRSVRSPSAPSAPSASSPAAPSAVYPPVGSAAAGRGREVASSAAQPHLPWKSSPAPDPRLHHTERTPPAAAFDPPSRAHQPPPGGGYAPGVGASYPQPSNALPRLSGQINTPRLPLAPSGTI